MGEGVSISKRGDASSPSVLWLSKPWCPFKSMHKKEIWAGANWDALGRKAATAGLFLLHTIAKRLRELSSLPC